MTPIQVSLVFLAGMGLSGLYFGGLWLSIQGLTRHQNLAVLFVLSFLLRTLIVLAGFYFLMAESWQRLLIALAGFIWARVLLARVLSRKPADPKTLSLKEVNVETQPR